MTLSKAAQAEKDKKAAAAKKAKADKDKKAKAAENKRPPAEIVPVVSAKTAARKPGIYIADGKSLTSKKGILGPGVEVKREYFAGSDELVKKMIESRIDSGHIVVVKP